MKRVSQDTWDKVCSLHSSQTLWDRITGRIGAPLSTFDEIAKSGEAGVIPCLGSFLLSSNREVRRAAARGIAGLFRAVQDADYPRLDELTRDQLSYEWIGVNALRRLRPAEVEALKELPSGSLMVGLASMHFSGYVREAAVESLSHVEDGTELPFLLLRLNDWVEEVRARAVQAVLSRIKPDYAPHFFRHLRLIDRLQRCGREAHAHVLEAIESLWTRPESASLFRAGIASEDHWIRRCCFRWALRSKTASAAVILKDALSDSDPVARLWSARGILGGLPEHELCVLLARLISDSFAPVRCEAVTVTARRLPNDAEAALSQALLDTHSSVRATARYYLQQRGVTEFRGVYLKALQDERPKIRRAAVAGLGETGEPEDAEIVKPFLKARQISLQKAAVRSIAALDGDRFVPELVSALLDEHRGLSREAGLALKRRLVLIDVDALWTAFSQDRPHHVRQNIMLLLFRLPTWNRIRFIIMASADSDLELSNLALQHCKNWFNRSRRVAPSRDEMNALFDLLREYEAKLDQAFVQTMRSWLAGYT